jgi:hypothetical protein
LGRNLGAHRRIGPRALAPLIVAAIAVSGCGNGPRQDASEPSGKFPVRIVSASFPLKQRLATTSNMTIVVRNPGRKKIPVVSVTMKCAGAKGGSGGSASNSGSGSGGFSYRTTQQGVADASRPVFIVNRVPTRTSRALGNGRRSDGPLDPLERTSAYVDTYPLGALKPGRQVRFTWNVTAVKPGPFHICYRVNAGLTGKAKAVPARQGERVTGAFVGEVAGRPPQAHIGADESSVVEGRAEDANTP